MSAARCSWQLGFLAILGCNTTRPLVDVASAATPAEAAMAEARNDAAEELDDELPRYDQRQQSSFEAEWDVIGLGESRTRAVLSTGWGFSVTPWMPEGVPGMRFLNVNFMLHTGDYGDTQYDAFHIQLGHDPRFAVFETTGIELLVGSRFRYTWTGAGQKEISGPPVFVDKSIPFAVRDSFSLGPTFGARLAEGALTIELFGEMAYAIDEPFLAPFEKRGGPTHWKPRGGVSVKTDLCFQLGFSNHVCYYPRTAQENVDLGSVMRRALRGLSPPPPDFKDRQTLPLCQAAARGVSLLKLGDDDDCGAFEADGFFCRTKVALTDAALKHRVHMVQLAHQELDKCTTQQRRSERVASAKKGSLQIRLQYGAYAPELRSDLGCDPDAPPRTLKEEEREAERASVERACELCPLACPEDAWWKPR